MNADKPLRKILAGKRWLKSCLLFFIVASCHTSPKINTLSTEEKIEDSLHQIIINKKAVLAIKGVKPLIKSGDIITRTGNDFTSGTLRQFNNKDKTYSHCGIALVQHDTVYVYHALGGDFNPDQKIKKDLLKDFAAPTENNGLGIYRHALHQTEIIKLIATAEAWRQLGILFDMKFDLQTNDRMYCAEFVYKALLVASDNRLHFQQHTINGFTYIGVDDLYLVKDCNEIKRIVYR